jgi:hypothetical protein
MSLRKLLRILPIIVFLGLSSQAFSQESSDPPRNKHMEKAQKKREKQAKKADKKAKKRVMDIQDKKTRKRMKKNKKQADRRRKNKGTPFFQRIFKKK